MYTAKTVVGLPLVLHIVLVRLPSRADAQRRVVIVVGRVSRSVGLLVNLRLVCDFLRTFSL